MFARLSDSAAESGWVSPRNRPWQALVSYAMGGAALQTPNATRDKVWVAWYEDGKVWVAPEDQSAAKVAAYTPARPILSLSLAFDGNMQPHIAVLQDDGIGVFMWWNSSTNQVEYLQLMDITAVQVCTDDERNGAADWSDVVLAYSTAASSLACRFQRERFTIEHILATKVKGRLYRLGMGANLRLQFEVLNKDF